MRGPQSLHKAIVDAGLEIDVLVNNAGVGMTSRFKDMPRSKIADIVNVNVRALTELTHLFLPAMIARGNGRILNVASVAAFRCGAVRSTVYSASKAYVLLFTRVVVGGAAWHQRYGHGVVSGLTKTEMVKDLEAANVPEFLMARAEDVAKGLSSVHERRSHPRARRHEPGIGELARAAAALARAYVVFPAS